MLAEHLDDVLERMQVLRESQLVLVSGTRGPDGIAPAQNSLQVFIGESSLHVIDHQTTLVRDKASTWSIVFSQEERLFATYRPRGARARNSLSAFTEFPKKRIVICARYMYMNI